MSILFSKYESSAITLKNRIVMPPMSRYAANDNGFPSPELIDYYLARAKKNVGLLIIEAASIDSTLSKSYINGLGFYTKSHSEIWKPVVKKIKSFGASVFIQLYHAGRLTTQNVCGATPIAPSAITPMKQRSHLMNVIDNKGVHFQGLDEFITPREITVEEIQDVQNKFESSCELAAEAGFDGVDLHGAHGNLIHQFLSKHTNQRRDKYGDDQYLFITELLGKCRNAMPKEILLTLRLSQHMVDFSFIRYSKKMMDLEEIVKRTEQFVDIYSCSEVLAGSPMFGHNRSLSEEVRSFTKKTIITSGQINTVSHAEKLLNSGNTDLVAFGRLLISNPDLVDLLQTKREDRIVAYDPKIHPNTII
jgi:2,4-dienoyl-CoA reductase-like NADH-dependent reductase (Old Yellow Enzyme family)